MRIYDVLYSMNTGDATPKARPFDNLLGQALSGDTEEKTIDFTPVISVSDAKAGAVLDYQCKITAVQTGTNPSPDNICPITGWMGANISVNGSTVAVSWQTEAGTVYVGTLDLTTGTLTVTHAMIDLGDYNYTKVSISGGRNVFYFPMSELTDSPKLPSSSSVPNAICSIFTGIAQSSSSWGVNTFVFTVFAGTIPGRSVGFIVNASDYDDEADFKTAMDGQKLIYELAEPITYTLTPTEITLSEGANTIWSDTGDSKLTYLAKK